MLFRYAHVSTLLPNSLYINLVDAGAGVDDDSDLLIIGVIFDECYGIMDEVLPWDTGLLLLPSVFKLVVR